MIRPEVQREIDATREAMTALRECLNSASTLSSGCMPRTDRMEQAVAIGRLHKIWLANGSFEPSAEDQAAWLARGSLTNEDVLDYFALTWPADLEWPADIPRPDPRKKETA